MGLGVLQDFNKLRLDTQAKNIAAWTPVVAEILQGFVRFDDKAVCGIIFFVEVWLELTAFCSSQGICLQYILWPLISFQERWRRTSVKAYGITS